MSAFIHNDRKAFNKLKFTSNLEPLKIRFRRRDQDKYNQLNRKQVSTIIKIKDDVR